MGSILKSLFGYNGNPSLLEVIAYSVYFGVVGAVNLWRGQAMVLATEPGA